MKKRSYLVIIHAQQINIRRIADDVLCVDILIEISAAISALLIDDKINDITFVLLLQTPRTASVWQGASRRSLIMLSLSIGTPLKAPLK